MNLTEKKEKCMEVIKNASCIELTTIEKYICTLIIALFMTSGNAFAHKDLHVTKEFGNVKVGIRTGFEYEEINNVALLGQLAEKLCIKLNYKEPVFLDFSHDYIGNLIPDFSISYNKVNNERLIVIRQLDRHFQAQTTLKLLEYAILNFSNIKSTDPLAIKEALNTPNSDLLNDILKVRIDRDGKDFKSGISYYLQNNKYYVFRKDWVYGGETVLFDIERIFDFKRTGNQGNWVIVFDSDSSFYYAGGCELSKRHEFNRLDNYRPYNIAYIGDDKIAIYFDYWMRERDEDEVGECFTVGDKEKTMIYIAEEDRLIQDFDKLLKKQ